MLWHSINHNNVGAELLFNMAIMRVVFAHTFDHSTTKKKCVDKKVKMPIASYPPWPLKCIFIWRMSLKWIVSEQIRNEDENRTKSLETIFTEIKKKNATSNFIDFGTWSFTRPHFKKEKHATYFIAGHKKK